MCDSDNEEFESADEDFEDVKKTQKVDKLNPLPPAPKSDVEPAKIDSDSASGKLTIDDDVGADLDRLDKSAEEPKKSAVRKIIRPDKERLKEAKLVVAKAGGEPKTAVKQLEPTTTGDGWDDFDDDWGDFSVDSSSGSKKTKEVDQKIAGTYASYKDVDIDEVENKLKDFMKGQDDPPVSSVLDRLSNQQDPSKSAAAGQSWSGWKPSWGGAAVSFLSSASKSVASITTNISQVWLLHVID